MICANCQNSNPDGAKFCMNCGSALTTICPKCGTALPAGAKFCFNCGQNLAAPRPQAIAQPAPAQPAAPAGLERFIPGELLAKLEAARAQGIEGERRIMSMLFCDVKGSTAAAGRMDPEEWAGIINGAFEHMIRPIYQYEGIVARLMGDGLLAFFGAPIAHEDDPQRAALAGLAIVTAIRPYGQEIKRQWGLELAVRVGINTGLVVVGAVGSDLRMEYTALGDAINMAARMEQTAEPGTVQIAEATYKLIAPLFDFEVLENVEVKGKSAPVRASRVLGPKTEPGSLRGIAGLRSRLIGRDHEVAALQEAIANLEMGQGGIISVMGEAGLGKSRLVAELRDALAAGSDLFSELTVIQDSDSQLMQRMHWLEGRSRSYETNTPFAPFIDLLSDCFGMRQEADDVGRYDQLKTRCELLFRGRGEEVAPFLASLLGIAVKGRDAERIKYLEPPMFRGQIFAHVIELIAQLAQQPLVLFLDDLHWIDPTSLELLEALMPLTERYPLLLLVAFRPRRQERSWRFHEIAQGDYEQRYTPLTLHPLDEEESRQLVANLLYVENLPPTVRRLILEKSEGNPFFVEEVIRSLLDNGLVVYNGDSWRATEEIVHIDVPATLVGVITARLDRLEESTRRIVQAGAVLGREFSFETLADCYDVPEMLETGLLDLQRRDMIREKGRLPHRVYSFKHVLTQEAAYNSILLSRRRELHRRAANSLITRQADRPADIAHHFLEARQPSHAVPYLLQAGDQAARNYASTEALDFYRQALDLREVAEENSLVRRSYEGLGNMLALTGQFEGALALYQAMLDYAESHDQMSMQISALNKLAFVIALRMGQFANAESYLARVEHMAQQSDDAAGYAEMSIIRCQMCTIQADFDGVIRHMSEVTAIGERLGFKGNLAMGLEHISGSLMYLTRFEEAETVGWQALEAARAVSDREHESWVQAITLPACRISHGDIDGARELAAEGTQIAARIGALPPQIYGNWILAELARWQGEYELALFYGQRSLQAALPLEAFMPFMTVQPLGSLGMVYLDISPHFTDRIGEFHLHAWRLLESPGGSAGGGTTWADLGWCALTLDDVEIAAECFEKGLNQPSIMMWLERPRNLAGAAMVASKQGRHTDAMSLIEEGCAYVEGREMRHLYPLMRLTAGRILNDWGDPPQALAHLEIAETFAAEMKMRPLLWQTQMATAAALEALGRHPEAAQKRQAAQEVIQTIAALFEDEDLRQAYLSRF